MDGIVDAEIRDQGAYEFLLHNPEALSLVVFVGRKTGLPVAV